MLPNGRVPSDGIGVFVHHEMKIQIMLCIPSMVQSAVSFDLKDHGPWSVTTDYEMSHEGQMPGLCRCCWCCVQGCEARITAWIRRPPWSFRGWPSEWADRDKIRGAGGREYVGSQTQCASLAGLAMRARVLVCLTTCQRRQTTPFRQPDGFGQA
jgi:hypothetical protein